MVGVMTKRMCIEIVMTCPVLLLLQKRRHVWRPMPWMIPSMQKTLKKLDMELVKEKSSCTTIQQLMKMTEDGRHKWIQDKQPLVDEILTIFPALKDRKTVSCKLLPCTQAQIVKNTLN